MKDYKKTKLLLILLNIKKITTNSSAKSNCEQKYIGSLAFSGQYTSQNFSVSFAKQLQSSLLQKKTTFVVILGFYKSSFQQEKSMA